MVQEKAVLDAVKEFNRRNGEDMASLLMISGERILVEMKPPCSCKWGLIGAVYELKSDLESAVPYIVSVDRVKRIDGKGFAISLFAKKREILRH